MDYQVFINSWYWGIIKHSYGFSEWDNIEPSTTESHWTLPSKSLYRPLDEYFKIDLKGLKRPFLPHWIYRDFNDFVFKSWYFLNEFIQIHYGFVWPLSLALGKSAQLYNSSTMPSYQLAVRFTALEIKQPLKSNSLSQ